MAKKKDLKIENAALWDIATTLAWILAHSEGVENATFGLEATPIVKVRYLDGQEIVWRGPWSD